MLYKLGLNPSPEPPRLLFGAYVQPPLLPTIPDTFGRLDMYPARGWNMLANDRIGCCTVAGGMHADMLWRALANKRVLFTPMDAQGDYFAITGGRDKGASMVQQAKYWQYTGFRDSMGNRHKILAYLHIDPKNIDHVDAACYLFKAVGLGIVVGDEEEQAFMRGLPWDNPDSPVSGGHYVPMVSKNPHHRTVITWGGTQEITEPWFNAKVNEVVAVLSNEYLVDGKSIDGFDLEALKADLIAVRS